ncbi:MAG: ATP synthase subunit I [Elusimicrobiota bacterium]
MKTIILGVAAGAIIGWANFWLISSSLKRTNFASLGAKKVFLFYLSKLVLLGVIFFLILKSGYFHPLGLVLGLFSLPLIAWLSTGGK